MHYRTLHVGDTHKSLFFLRRYLTEILRIAPLSENDTFDSDLSQAIHLFLARYNASSSNRLPQMIAVTEYLWQAVGEMLGENRLLQEVKSLRI